MPVHPRIAVVGYGAITREIVKVMGARGDLSRLAAVLVKPAHLDSRRAEAAGRFAVTDDAAALAAARPDVVLECAGHGGVAAHGAAILAAGLDLVVCSVGALADDAIATTLRRAAAGRARVLIPAGAVAGIDGLIAARTAGLESVTYTSVKAPHAWAGTPAERTLDLGAVAAATPFFAGTAREAARDFPQNANVGATVAFAGLGLDRTRVRLVADPAATGPLGIIEAAGAFGRFRFEILAYAAPDNPKTSLLTAHSMLAAADHGTAFDLPAA